MTNLDNMLKSRDITLSTKVHLVKVIVFPVVMYGCESWAIKKAEHWRIDAFELWVWRRLYESLGCKEIQPAHPKEDQSWVFIGRTDVEDETPILWPPNVKSWLIGKDPDAGKDWGQEEKGTTEDEMVGWHHQLLELTQSQVHWVGDAIQPSHPLLTPSLPAINLSQHQGLLKWVSSSLQVAKALGFQLQLSHPYMTTGKTIAFTRWTLVGNISPSNEHSGLISFRMDRLDPLAVQGTLNSLL